MTDYASAAAVLADALSLLRCPACGNAFSRADDALRDRRELACPDGHRVPVVNGIPRFVDVPDTDSARRTQASFGYEWTHFNDWRESGELNFNDYFAGLDLTSLSGQRVLDAGCGMGRHARQIAPHAGAVLAADFSRAIDQAARNTVDFPNVTCVQADLTALPVEDASFDFVYSLGVLHHLADTEAAIRALVRKVRPGGRLRIYLYWKRHGVAGALLSVVSLLRRITTRLPFPVLRGLCFALAVVLWGLVIQPYRFLSWMGMARHFEWPLFVYTKYPFAVLYNDQFDRFSAPIEKRYDPGDVETLMRAAGLDDIRIQGCYGWIADGAKPR